LYKYYANILGTGNRVVHFNRNTDPSCSFCTKAKILPAPLESFSHIFYDCVLVRTVLEKFFEKYFTIELARQYFLSGQVEQNGPTHREAYLIFDVVRYTIWQCKLQKQTLSFFTIEFETLRMLDVICGVSNKIKNSINQSQIIVIDGVRQPVDRPHP